MLNLRPILLALLVAALCAPAAAQAQLPPAGPMAPPELAQPPAEVPPGPVGKWPEHWAECIREHPAATIVPPGIDPRGVDPAAPNPLLGLRWFVDRMEPAYANWARYKRSGRSAEADTIWRLAGQPRFRWFGRFSRPDLRAKVKGFINRVQCDQPGATPQLVVMRHAGHSCAPGYDGGGPREDARTRKWYRVFAEAVGDARVLIAFEPDSLGTVDCLIPSRRDDRIELLRYGVEQLAALPNATVYIEAGASDWEPAARTAKQLRRVGVGLVRGFVLNATHHDWTRANIEHGLEISRRVGGKPFVINTSHNGRGPVSYKRWINRAQHLWRRITVWCNPRYRGLGPAPSTATAHAKVDAYLYVNRPGYSDGSCNGGPLPVGTWWPEEALSYSRFATSWLSPPHGTRFGHHKRLSLRAVGG